MIFFNFDSFLKFPQFWLNLSAKTQLLHFLTPLRPLYNDFVYNDVVYSITQIDAAYTTLFMHSTASIPNPYRILDWYEVTRLLLGYV